MLFEKRIRQCFLFLVLLAALTKCAYAEIIEVRPGENIQNAINQAVSGDTVFLFEGTYKQDVAIENKNGVTLKGEAYYNVILEGNLIAKDTNASIEDITIHYGEASPLPYLNLYYSDWRFSGDAGITAINSDIAVRNCAIQPNPDYLFQQNLTHYGKAIQVWNLYENLELAPQIENSLIQNAECGIYYFAQAASGSIYGEIKNNTFHHNKAGILLRMHKENPHTYNNIFEDCLETALHYTYEDGELLAQRKLNLNNNLFYANAKNIWADAEGETSDIVELQGNIAGDPLFIDPANDSFYLDSEDSPCVGMGMDGTDIGAYSPDLAYPAISAILPQEDRFTAELNLDISGSVSDDTGILSVYVNSEPAVIDGSTFIKEAYALDYGLNNLIITATDVAKKDTAVSKPIYIYRKPIAPPQISAQ